jgi:hypothetical protein
MFPVPFSSPPRFFEEFILSWGTFFDRLRMSGRKSLMKIAKGSDSSTGSE